MRKEDQGPSKRSGGGTYLGIQVVEYEERIPSPACKEDPEEKSLQPQGRKEK